MTRQMAHVDYACSFCLIVTFEWSSVMAYSVWAAQRQVALLKSLSPSSSKHTHKWTILCHHSFSHIFSLKIYFRVFFSCVRKGKSFCRFVIHICTPLCTRASRDTRRTWRWIGWHIQLACEHIICIGNTFFSRTTRYNMAGCALHVYLCA